MITHVLLFVAEQSVTHVGCQFERLYQELLGSVIVLTSHGHIVHHLNPDAVAAAINCTAQRSSPVPAIRSARASGEIILVVEAEPGLRTYAVEAL